MTYIISLAHYCDIHGPTPLMVTEGLPASCNTCYDDDHLIPRSTANQNPNVADALGQLSLTVPQDSSTQQRGSSRMLETPPGSPRHSFQQSRDSSFKRTYDDAVTKKQGPCDNCAMTLPKSSSKGADPKGPTLRTRAPAERVFGIGGQQSPPNSQSSSDTDGEHEGTRRPRNRRLVQATSSRNTSCSSTSSTDTTASFHVHYVDYTSTHEPVMPSSFSLLRASCLRTLSFETLPRAPTTAVPTTCPSSGSPSPFVTTQAAGSAASGGPIFFGDALAGYTTAYIFRIPDVHARGHKRVYAFMALSTHKERLAMKTFAMISAAFRELAVWIQQLAEAEAAESASSSSSGTYYNGGHQGFAQPAASAFDPPATNGSSFLTGGSGFTRRMAGAGASSAPKARGLAELVGQPDIFLELHRRFVQLLFEVGVTLNS